MLTALIILGYVVFILVLLAGVLATLLALPGTFLILLDAVVFSACTGFERPSLWALGGLLIMALVAETADNVLSMLATRYGGGSSRTGIAAMVGGITGALVGAAVAPAFGAIGALGGVVGFLLGVVIVPLALALVGGFVAAYWYELRQGKPSAEAVSAGKAALLGRLAGGLAKGIVAILMVAITLYTVF